MKTSLSFEAPSDLSVGRVRISNQAGEVANWVATPGNRRFVAEEITPGFYSAEISPAGVAPQSIIFEVKNGVANTVSTPEFSSLSALGSGTTFLDIADQRSAINELYGTMVQPQESARVSNVVKEMSALHAVPIVRKRLSIGLSREVDGKRESWQAFEGQASPELVGGRVNLQIHSSANLPWSGERVRLTLAIEKLRVEHLLLPMYRGGTMITVTPSTLSASDVELLVLPVEPKLRALHRALQAGTTDDATAVHEDVLREGNLGALFATSAGDPWGAMLAGLLFVRFPQVFGELAPSLAEQLVALAPWAYDSHVIRARQLLNASAEASEGQVSAAETSLTSLDLAQQQGSPYYSYSNRLFGEMIEALCAFFDDRASQASKQAEQIRQRWRRDNPLQSSAGLSFSWLGRDPDKLKQGVLAPDRGPSGELHGNDISVIFKGQIEAGQIKLDAPAQEATGPKRAGLERTHVSFGPAASFSVPSPDTRRAMRRSAGPASDPNKGRFGGKSARDGFALRARFGSSNQGERVAVTLSVDADESIVLGYGEIVWFYLHPTFRPQQVKVMFRGRSAMLGLQTWGGFTVGAWLPSREVELECDLAELPDAPSIVRNR